MQALAFHAPQRESYVSRNGSGTGISTPWGKAQSVRTYARGVKQVMTAGHGGLGITVGVANAACLSHPARKVAELKGTTFWFEEDCLWAVAAWELGPTFWPVYFADNGFEPDAFGGTALLDASEYRYRTNEVMKRMSVRRYLAQTISAWNPEYFLEMGLESMLTEPEYTRWKENRETDRRRAALDPDLITSAMSLSPEKVVARYGEGLLEPMKVTRVHTADGKYHDVYGESYSSRRGLTLLSGCQVLASDIGEGFY